MKLPREPFSWDGGDKEEPIPLTEEGLAVLSAAEAHVRSAQDALARQDTDPALIDLRDATPSLAETSPSQRSGRLVRLALVVAVCTLAFAHGWEQGAAQASPKRCVTNHCDVDLGP